MSDTPNTPENSDIDAREKRLKRVYFRAHHRGIKELDIIIGKFADLYLEELNDEDLYEFECLLTVPDQTFYAILRGDVEAPDHVKSAILDRMIKFTADQGL